MEKCRVAAVFCNCRNPRTRLTAKRLTSPPTTTPKTTKKDCVTVSLPFNCWKYARVELGNPAICPCYRERDNLQESYTTFELLNVLPPEDRTQLTAMRWTSYPQHTTVFPWVGIFLEICAGRVRRPSSMPALPQDTTYWIYARPRRSSIVPNRYPRLADLIRNTDEINN